MRPVILIVLDGFGIAPPGPGNAIYLANPVNINSFLYTYPNTVLKASGPAVGLPSGEVGNTEVGHLNLGAGRIVYQDLPRINMSIADGSLYKNKTLLETIEHAQKNKGALHLVGLVGEGAVHSSIEHLFALLYVCKEHKFNRVFLHVITDGRDSPPNSGLETVNRLSEKIESLGIGTIASVIGRYYAMDRDRRWERTEKAYNCLTKGSQFVSKTAAEAIHLAYSQGKSDEFIEATNIVGTDGRPLALISSGDAVIFFNYRIDRPKQLTKAFVLDDFQRDANKIKSFDPYAIKYFKTHIPKDELLTEPFQRGPKISNLFFSTMTEYEKNLEGAHVIFPPLQIHMPLGRVISEAGKRQLRISESEKERFVTFYFNGQNDLFFPQEDRMIIPSPKIATYDLKPEMSVFEITNFLISKIPEKKYSFILVNFANPDMVGHTGNIQATIQAIKAVDSCLLKIVQECSTYDCAVLITADHGNAEEKINPHTGQISTEHTDNPVPFVAISSQLQGKFVRLQSGILADVAPTILALMEIPKPSEMTGRNLLEEIR